LRRFLWRQSKRGVNCSTTRISGLGGGGVFLEDVSRGRKRNRDILLGTWNVRSHIQQHKRKSERCANYKFVTGETTKIPPKYKKATTDTFDLFLLFWNSYIMTAYSTNSLHVVHCCHNILQKKVCLMFTAAAETRCKFVFSKSMFWLLGAFGNCKKRLFASSCLSVHRKQNDSH
jgi:hypothetical protein